MSKDINILYNVTVKVEHEIVEEWKSWMQEVHIPDVLKTACFSSAKLNKLLYLDDNDGVTFAVQYIAPNLEAFDDYQEKFAPELQKQHVDKYGNKAVAFRTLMEIIYEA